MREVAVISGTWSVVERRVAFAERDDFSVVSERKKFAETPDATAIAKIERCASLSPELAERS